MTEHAYPELSFNGISAQFRPFCKYVEQFAITIPAGSTSATHTLGKTVDPTKCIRIYNNKQFNGLGDYNQINPRISLTNGTTVTATKNTSAADDVIVQGVIIELWPWAVKNIQEGTLAIGTASVSSTTTDITGTVPADLANTVVFWLGTSTDSTGGGISTAFTTLALSASGSHVQVTASIGASGNNTVTGYCAITFAPGIIKQKIDVTVQVFNGSTTASATIAAVNMNHTMSVSRGYQFTSGFEGDLVAGKLASSTSFSIQRSDNFPTSRMLVTLIELFPEWIKSVQRNITAITLESLTENITITAVNTAKAFAVHMGVSSAYQFSLTGQTTPTLQLLNATTVQLQRQNHGDFSHQTSEGWEAVELR